MLRNLDAIFPVRSDKTGACPHSVGYAESTVGGRSSNPSGSLCLEGLYARQRVCQSRGGFLGIVIRLQAEPKSAAGAEKGRQALNSRCVLWPTRNDRFSAIKRLSTLP